MITNPTVKHNLSQLLARAEGDKQQVSSRSDKCALLGTCCPLVSLLPDLSKSRGGVGAPGQRHLVAPCCAGSPSTTSCAQSARLSSNISVASSGSVAVTALRAKRPPKTAEKMLRHQ